MRVFRNQVQRIGDVKYHFDIQITGKVAAIFNVWFWDYEGEMLAATSKQIEQLYKFV